MAGDTSRFFNAVNQYTVEVRVQLGLQPKTNDMMPTDSRCYGGDMQDAYHQKKQTEKSSSQNGTLIIPRVPKMRTRKEHYIHWLMNAENQSMQNANFVLNQYTKVASMPNDNLANLLYNCTIRYRVIHWTTL